MSTTVYDTPRCPGSLKEGFTTYNPATIRNLFNGKKVFHVLENAPEGELWENARVKNDDFPTQIWYRLELVKNKLQPSANGDYLLKTAASTESDIRFSLEQPANEHTCLQLAGQVFKIETLQNALIFFPDGKPAIIYKYFSELNNFKSFGELFSVNHPKHTLKNHLQIMETIDKYSAAVILAKERYFLLVLYSWLTTNATAHAKICGLVKTVRGDYILAPVNSIQCTRLHQLCDELTMQGGLFDGDRNTPEFRENGHYSRNEFSSFARRSGIAQLRAEKIIDFVFSKKNEALNLIDLAFLPDEAKNILKYNFQERIVRLE